MEVLYKELRNIKALILETLIPPINKINITAIKIANEPKFYALTISIIALVRE